MLNSSFLLEDEDFFSDIFKDALYLVDFCSQTKVVNNADDAETAYSELIKQEKKPDCVFVDINLVGSSFDGIEFIRRVNYEYGNHVVIGIISGSEEPEDISRAVKAGAQFHIVKTDDVIPRIEEFKEDFPKFKNRKLPFKTYR